MKLLQTKHGFSKMGILITVGIFVLVVAISIPVAFGFIKEDHPEVTITPSDKTETTSPSDEVELGIIDKILPSDMDFEENVENPSTNDKEDGSETTAPTNPSNPNKNPSYTPNKPIKGEADTNTNLKVEIEEDGVTIIPETKPSDKYEDVDVKDEDVVVIPPVVDTTPEDTTPPTTTPSEPEEDDVVGKELEEIEDGEMPDFLP